MGRAKGFKSAEFVIYAAIEIPGLYMEDVLYRPGKDGKPIPYVPQLEQDKEVVQLSIEVPCKPISEKKFREAMHNMTESLLQKATTAGLVVSV